MAKDAKPSGSWKIPLIAFVAGVVLAAVVTAQVTKSTAPTAADVAPKQSAPAPAEPAENTDVTPDEPLDLQATFPSWNADSPSLAKLIEFVDDVTDESSPNYVEPADRIATFDMDGTIICEKAPVYVDYMMFLHRVLDDPTYKAPASIVRDAKKIRANADAGVVDSAYDKAKNEGLAQVFAGMTQEEFGAYVNNFLDTVDVEGFSGMTYGGSFYRPMCEVINYLRAKGFDVYMVSACEREVVRAVVADRIGIAPDHVLGTDLTFEATGQGSTPGDEYTVTQDDDLVLSGVMLDSCAKGNKVLSIQREIGKTPILAFGNSSGDFAMLNYAQGNDQHQGMGVLVVADDTEREYGNEEKAQGMFDEVAAQGWTAFSMHDDWATIYGEGVEKTALVADEELAEAA